VVTVDVSDVLFGQAPLGEIQLIFGGIPAAAATDLPLGYKKGPDLCLWDLELGDIRVFDLYKQPGLDGTPTFWGSFSDCGRIEEIDGDWIIGGPPGGCEGAKVPGGKATWKAWLAEVQAGQRCQDY
jgi:hypothetical protein